MWNKLFFIIFCSLLLFCLLDPANAMISNILLGGAYSAARCFAQTGDRYYALPGIRFAIDMGSNSATVTSRYAQKKISQSIIQSLMQQRGLTKDTTCLNAQSTNDGEEPIPCMPFCFIANTDSIHCRP